MSKQKQTVNRAGSLPLGNLAQAVSRTNVSNDRGGAWGVFLHYLKMAFRGLTKYKWQNIVCILGLAVGFSAFALGGYWWYWENNFDDFHPNARHTFGITTTGITKASDGSATELDQLPGDDAAWILQNIPEIEQHCSTGWAWLKYTHGGKTERIMGLSVEPSFFTMFYAEFIDGGYEHDPFDGGSIVLTERAAMKYFGKTACTGEVFPDGTQKVAGVIKDYPSNSDFRFEFLTLARSVSNNVGRSTFYVQLNRHARVNDVRKKIESHQSIAKARFPGEDTKEWSFNLRTLSEIHLNCHPELKSRFRNIQLLALAGFLGLISSLMNHLVLFAGLQQRRQRRNNTFRSLGASTSYLFLRSFIDLLIPLVFALILSVAFVRLIFPYYQSYTQWQGYGMLEKYISKVNFNAVMYTSLKWTGLIIVLFLMAGSLVIAGILRKTGGQTPFSPRRGLIICQVFIGSFFLFIALSLYKQFYFTKNKDKGIHVENIIQIDAGVYGIAEHQTMKKELLRSPYIEEVTLTTTPVLTERGDHYLSYITNITLNEERYNEIRALMVEPNFKDFFGITMKEGDWMSGETEVVMNEAQTHSLGNINLVGHPIKMAGLGEGKISGIIHNYNYSTMQYPVVGLMFHLPGKEAITAYEYAYIKTKPENRTKALEHAQKILETMETDDIPEEKRFRVLTDIMEEFNRPERTLSLIFGILSLTCILVVSFGIYSLITLTIEQRRKEIAIRKVNGAEFTDMLRLFFREYFVLVIIGNVFALTVGYYLMQRWFETYTYHTTLSWWLFAVVLAITCIIVFLSVVSKISEAAKVHPAEALKYE